MGPCTVVWGFLCVLLRISNTFFVSLSHSNYGSNWTGMIKQKQFKQRWCLHFSNILLTLLVTLNVYWTSIRKAVGFSLPPASGTDSTLVNAGALGCLPKNFLSPFVASVVNSVIPFCQRIRSEAALVYQRQYSIAAAAFSLLRLRSPDAALKSSMGYAGRRLKL